MARVKGGVALGLVAAAMLTHVCPAARASDSLADAAQNAVIVVELQNMRVEKTGETYRFVHDRAFIERGGVGVTLTQGQVCFSSGICQGKPVEYRIEANGIYVIKDAELAPLGPEEVFAYTYQGQDDNGHPVYVFFRVTVSGDKYELSP
jgi:hypothetical protein